MNKDLTVSILMDFYGNLLTKKQLDALDMYYNSDLSLSEIAEETGISRQGARDAIKRGEKQLAEFEEKLGLAGRFLDVIKSVDEMNKVIETLEITDENREKIEKIKEISENLSDKL